MNLVDVRADSSDGRVRLHLGAQVCPLWPGHQSETTLRLGVRPDHLQLVGPDTDESALRFDAVVATIEKLGHETLIHADTAVGRLIARAPADYPVIAGDRVTLAARVEHLHFFDIASGARLRWSEQADAADPVGPSLARAR